MVTHRLSDRMRETSSFHSVSSGARVQRPSSLQTISEKSWSSSISGASYKFGRVMFSITQSGFTLQNMAILRKISGSSGSSQRSTMMSGAIPIPCSSFTECCVGLVLCSSLPLRKGTRVT